MPVSGERGEAQTSSTPSWLPGRQPSTTTSVKSGGTSPPTTPADHYATYIPNVSRDALLVRRAQQSRTPRAKATPGTAAPSARPPPQPSAQNFPRRPLQADRQTPREDTRTGRGRQLPARAWHLLSNPAAHFTDLGPLARPLRTPAAQATTHHRTTTPHRPESHPHRNRLTSHHHHDHNPEQRAIPGSCGAAALWPGQPAWPGHVHPPRSPGASVGWTRQGCARRPR